MWRWAIILWAIGVMMLGIGFSIVRRAPSTAQWIAFSTKERLYLISSDGGVQKELDRAPLGYFSALAWADGWLYYERYVRGVHISSQYVSTYQRYDPQSGIIERLHDQAPPPTDPTMTLQFRTLAIAEQHPSPNGHWIAFTAYDIVRPPRAQTRGVFVARADGSELLRLSPLSFTTDAYGVAWSPNSEWIAFSAHVRNDDNLFKVRYDGTGLHQLTRNAAYDQTPIWSVDGRWIIFTSDRTGYVELYRVPADGTEEDVQMLTRLNADIQRHNVTLSSPYTLKWRGWRVVGIGGVVIFQFLALRRVGFNTCFNSSFGKGLVATGFGS